MRVERRPWAKGGNQIFNKPWALPKLGPSLEVFFPCRNPFYDVHPARLSLLSNGICLAVRPLQKLDLLSVEICVFSGTWSRTGNNTVNSAVAEKTLLTLMWRNISVTLIRAARHPFFKSSPSLDSVPLLSSTLDLLIIFAGLFSFPQPQSTKPLTQKKNYWGILICTVIHCFQMKNSIIF